MFVCFADPTFRENLKIEFSDPFIWNVLTLLSLLKRIRLVKHLKRLYLLNTFLPLTLKNHTPVNIVDGSRAPLQELVSQADGLLLLQGVQE